MKYDKVGSTRTRSGRAVGVFTPKPVAVVKANPVGPNIRGWSESTPIAPPEGFEELAIQGYALNAIARTAIDKMAGFVASIPLKLQRHGAKGEWEDVGTSEDDEHPLMTLLTRPNPRQSYAEYIKAMVGYRFLSGQAYELPNGPAPTLPPTELWLARPDYMRCVPGDDGLVNVWQYRNGRGTIPFDMRKKQLVPPVMQWKTFNPLSDWYGLPPLRAAAMQLAQHNHGARWNANVLRNGMRAPGMFEYDDGHGGTLTDTQREQLKQSYADAISGPDNAGVPIIGEGGVKWKEMSIAPKDLDWLEGMRDAARIVCLVFGVPPLLLNIPGDNTYKNYGEARESAYLDGAIPLAQGLVDDRNVNLVPAFGEGIRLALDLDKVEALSDYRMRTIERVDKIRSLTTNEKRAMMGKPRIELPIADEVMASSGDIPLSLAGEPPEPVDETTPLPEDDTEEGKKPIGKKPKKPVAEDDETTKAIVMNLRYFAR